MSKQRSIFGLIAVLIAAGGTVTALSLQDNERSLVAGDDPTAPTQQSFSSSSLSSADLQCPVSDEYMFDWHYDVPLVRYNTPEAAWIAYSGGDASLVIPPKSAFNLQFENELVAQYVYRFPLSSAPGMLVDLAKAPAGGGFGAGWYITGLEGCSSLLVPDPGSMSEPGDL